MMAEFQLVVDFILKEFPNAHAVIDDILVPSKGSEMENIAIVEKIWRKLDRGNMALKLPKCDFKKLECEWLGHKITASGITQLVSTSDLIDKLQPPQTLSQLKSLLGSIHSLHKYLPVLAETSAPLRPLLAEQRFRVVGRMTICVWGH